MQQIKQTRQINKKTFLAIIIIILMAAIGGSAAYALDLWPFNAKPEVPGEVSKTTNTEVSKEELDEQKDSAYSGKNTDEIPVNKDQTATITSLYQQDGYITLTATITTPDASGQCSIIFTNSNNKPVTRVVNASLQNNVTVCDTIQIPEQDFSSLGPWHVTLRYIVNETSQTVTEGNLTIQ